MAPSAGLFYLITPKLMKKKEEKGEREGFRQHLKPSILTYMYCCALKCQNLSFWNSNKQHSHFPGFGIKLCALSEECVKLYDPKGPFWLKFCYSPADSVAKILFSDGFVVLLPLCSSFGGV